ncbi:MAG: acylphosphatase [Burkholderiales bacterium]|nr:acylphosphatase [Burkholderiales bacterium]
MAATRRLIVRGRLQGTRMAEALAAEASALGVTGWVQERGDGTIEAVVQGDEDLVATLVDWSTRGTSDALVSGVEITGADGSFTCFEHRPAAPGATMTRRLVVHGRVQGVGFREALRTRALSLDIAGWVRNCSDGTVEALAHGQADRVQELIDWARRGPPAARVTRVQVEEASGRFSGFERRPTV